MTTQAVPFAGLDAGQLAVQQATLRVQAELAEELAASPLSITKCGGESRYLESNLFSGKAGE